MWLSRAGSVRVWFWVGSSVLVTSCGPISGHQIARYFNEVAELEAEVTALDSLLEKMTRELASGAPAAVSLGELQRKKERIEALSAELAALQPPPACEKVHQLEESYFQQVEASLSFFMTEALPSAANPYRRHFAASEMQGRLEQHAHVAMQIRQAQEQIAAQHGIKLEE